MADHAGVDLALGLGAAADLGQQDHVARRAIAASAQHASRDDRERRRGGKPSEKLAAVERVHA